MIERRFNITSKAPEFVPPVKEYKAAFKKIEEQMTEKRFQMLDEHYKSDCFWISQASTTNMGDPVYAFELTLSLFCSMISIILT